nr:5815_t:CDS:10 [Entrophospora candida]
MEYTIENLLFAFEKAIDALAYFNNKNNEVWTTNQNSESSGPVQLVQVNEEASVKSKTSSIVHSILHGSAATKEEDKHTHSKLIARGKYVHEFQKHKIKPEYVDDYIKLISLHYPRIANDPDNSVHLCGSWQTEIGDLDTFGYHDTYNRLNNDSQYQQFLKKVRPMLLNRYSQICLEFAFWKTSPPAVHGGIYELRTYELKPGNLLEWETHWHRGLECRRQFCEPVGAWFSQLGFLNCVHHMWQYPDLENRKITREKAWEVDGWAETVYKTVRLVQKMEANILKPLDFKYSYSGTGFLNTFNDYIQSKRKRRISIPDILGFNVKENVEFLCDQLIKEIESGVEHDNDINNNTKENQTNIKEGTIIKSKSINAIPTEAQACPCQIQGERSKLSEKNTLDNERQLKIKELATQAINSSQVGSTIMVDTCNYVSPLLSQSCHNCGDISIDNKNCIINNIGFSVNTIICCEGCNNISEFSNDTPKASTSVLVAGGSLLSGINRQQLSFDVSWSHVRNANQATGEFIFQSSRQMEQAILIACLEKITPNLDKENILLDIGVNGDLDSNKTLKTERVVNKVYGDLKHATKIIRGKKSIKGNDNSNRRRIEECASEWFSFTPFWKSLFVLVRNKKIDFWAPFRACHAVAILDHHEEKFALVHDVQRSRNLKNIHARNIEKENKIIEQKQQLEAFDYDQDLVLYGMRIKFKDKLATFWRDIIQESNQYYNDVSSKWTYQSPGISSSLSTPTSISTEFFTSPTITTSTITTIKFSLLLLSPTLKTAKSLINDYNSGKIQDIDPEKLWKAKKTLDSTIHPDTGEPIFLPFRMSCFVPTNLVVVAGMLMPNPSMKSLIFWQWANQSINVAINYSNANKTTPLSFKETAIAYTSAVTTSCVLAVGLTQAVPRMRFLKPSVRGLLSRLVPFFAVASAGTVNVYLMRLKEIRNGIDVYDANGNNLGKSQKAGASAVGQVAISRILTNSPVLTIPPIVLSQLEKTSFLKHYPRLLTPINFGLITISLMTALPLAIAAFPQYASIDPMKLETKFWELKDENGNVIKRVFYNKGL